MPREKYFLRYPVSFVSTLTGWGITLLVFFLILNAVFGGVTEVLPIVLTSGLSACIFSFFLASYADHQANSDHKIPYKLLLKGLIYGLVASFVISAASAFFLLYGISQIIGACIGIISTLCYWFYPKAILPTSALGAAKTLGAPVFLVAIFILVLWPLAEKHAPSMIYPLGTWDARARMENGVASSIKVGDEFSQYERFAKMVNGYTPVVPEGGFMLGHMPTRSFCVRNGIIVKIKVFERDENIWFFHKCDEE